MTARKYPVRFRFEPAPSWDMVAHVHYHTMTRDDLTRATRAARLLLAWWAWGHDPRRHYLACHECEGSGQVPSQDCGGFYANCEYCDGTGRSSVKS